MKMSRLFLVAALILVSAATTFGQDTKIRFFGQPEIDFGKSTEKNRVDGVSPTGQYIKRDTTYDAKTNFNTGVTWCCL